MARDKKCPQCAEMVKAEAKVCRFCGHQFAPETIARPALGRGKGCLIGVAAIFGIGLIGSITNNGHSTANSTNAADASVGSTDAMPEGRKLQIETAEAAGRAIRKAVRNPDSLVIELGLASDDGHLVCVRYRAQNGFGGMNRETLAFFNGAPKQSASFWNKHCNVPLNDVTYAVKSGVGLPF